MSAESTGFDDSLGSPPRLPASGARLLPLGETDRRGDPRTGKTRARLYTADGRGVQIRVD